MDSAITMQLYSTVNHIKELEKLNTFNQLFVEERFMSETFCG
jgi:hypothetical protein